MTTLMTNRSGGRIDTTIWLDQCHMTLISQKSTVPAEAVSISWTMTMKTATGMRRPLVKNHNALASRSWKPINSSQSTAVANGDDGKYGPGTFYTINTDEPFNV